MQVNRLSQLLFPPVSPTTTTTVNAGLLDASDTETRGAASGSAAEASRAQRASATSQTSESHPEPAPQASVKLDLDSGQRNQGPSVYGRDGLFAGKSGVEVANTPAERFVARAVDIMRAYEQANAQPAAQGPFDRIRQAMSRLSAQA